MSTDELQPKAKPHVTSVAPTAQSEPVHSGFIRWMIFARAALVPLMVSLLTLWVALGRTHLTRNTPRTALAAVGIVVTVVAIWSQRPARRAEEGREEPLEPNEPLPDLLGALYLAALVLVGQVAAIIFAIVTPLVAALARFGWTRRASDLPQNVVRGLWQGMASSLTLLVAGSVYVSVALSAEAHVRTSLRAHVLAALAASIVTLVGMTLTSLVPRMWKSRSIAQPLREYLHGPTLLFEVMLLCCVPILPLTESLDPVETEFTWILLLIPMGAVYYLALTSMRLRHRTIELQRTIAQLHETKARETQLTSYAALITRVQEDERRRLARDLHDDTAQSLVVLVRGLDSLSRAIDSTASPEDKRYVEQLVEHARSTLDGVRRAYQDLRPSVLDDFGLAAALDSLAQSMRQRGLPCNYAERGVPRPYPPEVEVTVYRIAQEALANALRHSEATFARVELAYEADGLHLSVSDNGIGFDPLQSRSQSTHTPSQPSAEEKSTGLGILGMRERAKLIGASLSIESAFGRGAQITVDVPNVSDTSGTDALPFDDSDPASFILVG